MLNKFLPFFVMMLFLHIVDDFVMQGCLANLKQKRFWENDPIGKEPKYKNDYIIALFMHSFSWTFMIMLPIFVYAKFDLGWLFLLYPANMAIHAHVDDLKANKLKINLFEDQVTHLMQIIVSLTISGIVLGV